MCQISNTIRFCTCEVESMYKLQHYWALYRYNPNKKWNVIGETILPIIDEQFEVNQSTLLDILNNKDPFDVEMKFEHKDRFKLPPMP